MAHFWDVDRGYDAGLDDPALPVQCDTSPCPAPPDLPAEIRERRGPLHSGDSVFAAWWLGADGAPHGGHGAAATPSTTTTSSTRTNYEKYVAESERYRGITYESPNTEIPDVQADPPPCDASRLRSLPHPPDVRHGPLGNDFDSDDENGRSTTYGGGQFRFARREIPSNKPSRGGDYEGFRGKDADERRGLLRLADAV